MIDPVVTYRIQFHKNFTFADFGSILPYLKKLGITTIYASPVFEATPGSTHGYDIVNPHKINSEIGTEEELRELSKNIKRMGMQWIQDIVPNHMAFHSNNLWLMDVLEKGRYSVYANFFDMAWASELFHGHVIVPVLSGTLEDALDHKELEIAYTGSQLVIQYFNNVYPLHPRSYRSILESEQMPESLRQITQQIEHLHQVEEPIAYALRWHELLLQLGAQTQDADVLQYVNSSIKKINEDSSLLKPVLGEQTYRLTPFQITDRRITFRRFFTVNELLGINMHDQKVFDHYHRYILKFVEDGVFQGLRVDHVDGLLDPSRYLDNLRKLVGPDVYIVAEKILKSDESLPTWPVQGTTGYEFLAKVNQAMTDARGKEGLTKHYASIIHEEITVQEDIHRKKRHMLEKHMYGEWENLAQLFCSSGFTGQTELTLIQQENIKQCLGEFLVRFPVYRFYGNSIPLPVDEQRSIRQQLDHISDLRPSLKEAAAQIKNALLTATDNEDPTITQRRVVFYLRFMQLTGPLMAKGVEDTFFYTYNRFISQNEVGDDPASFGLSVGSFHYWLENRQQQWPLNLNATSTHDTKRGEDVRARLNVLAAIPQRWSKAIASWEKMIAIAKESGAPDSNDAYFILQTIVGAYPLMPEDDFAARMEAYVVKSLRESKRNSDWVDADEEYESFAIQFVRSLLNKTGPFLKSLEKFLPPIIDAGLLNSLVQVVLKFACPGVPDIYQGCEQWDFSLVDPDNRRAVNFDSRAAALEEFITTSSSLETLWQTRNDGRIKQFLVHALCKARSENSKLFSEGEYIPFEVDGRYKDNILAFGRKHQGNWVVTVVPLFVAAIANEKDVTKLNWRDTVVILPQGIPARSMDMLNNVADVHDGKLFVKDIFKSFPLSILHFKAHTDGRHAGMLLHITSLPGPFAIGDFGPVAHRFAEFLQRAKQSCWQVLPINPTDRANGYSPYSAFSSMAGNTLLISPELLVSDGLLTDDDIRPHYNNTDRTEYGQATAIRDDLFDKGWKNFKSDFDHPDQVACQQFVAKEASWLNDFALFVVLKKIHGNQPWNCWPPAYKHRNEQALQALAEENTDEVNKIKWLQFVFDKQWNQLKEKCNRSGIKLIGDLPFYVIYDSVDVWSSPENFSLDERKEVQHIAGVPPDYFNANGQLWGMPVFNWTTMKRQRYDWWINRLRKITSLFDLVRLDHFRAFAGYWQVHASEQTAINGAWNTGPGIDFFEDVKQALGTLPFIAEDLGEITPDVYTLRDAFTFPGMKVLQFAFGKDLPYSSYAPHNYTNNFIVYTGTHDNNTTKAWFTNDCKTGERKNIQRYAGVRVNKDNVTNVLIRLAYASVCKTVIVPLQDVLCLGGDARMNKPGTSENNWLWRLNEFPDERTEKYISGLTSLYNRDA